MRKLSFALVLPLLCGAQTATMYNLTDASGGVVASVAYTPAVSAAGTAARFVDSIGVNTHLLYTDTGYGNGAFVASEVIKLGVKHVRDGSALAVSTTQYPNAYAAFLQMGAAGVRFASGNGTAIATNPHVLSYSSTAFQSAAKLVSSTAGTSYIEALEGPNEIDISGDAAWPTDWAVNEANLLAANTSGFPVYSGSLAFSANFAKLSVQPATATAYANLHGYAGNAMPGVLWPTALNNIRTAFPTQQIVQTETGYYDATASGLGFVDDATQAKYIPRLLLESFRNGIYRTYLYELLDEISTWNTALQQPTGPNSCVQCSYGLVTAAGAEKPAFTAVRNLIAILGNGATATAAGSLPYTITGGNASLHQLLLQKSANVFDLVLWQEVSSMNTATSLPIANSALPVTLAVNARSVVTCLPSASTAVTQRQLQNGQVSLAVPDEAMVVEITR